MSAIEIWRSAYPVPGTTAALARTSEAEGWDGLTFADSQNVCGDPYGALCLAAGATQRLLLRTGVTNPVTRHPAVTASAIATVHAESGGRAVLGIGRGDSSLLHLGQEPASLRAFERYLTLVQGYLRGETVDLDGHPSRLEWLPALGLPKVPLDVTATGPRVIDLGARLAERVTFAVGADGERLGQVVARARHARRAAGLDPDTLSLGAYVNVAAHPDVAVARDWVRGLVAIFVHFAGLPGATTAWIPPRDRVVVERMSAEYDMAGHGSSDAAHARSLDDDFIDRFAVAGPPDYCLRRIEAIAEMGFDRLVLSVGSPGLDPRDRAAANALVVRDVLPGVKAMSSREPRTGVS